MMEERIDPRFFIKLREGDGTLTDLDSAWTEEELERKIKMHVQSGVDPAKIHVHADLTATVGPDGDVRIEPAAFGLWWTEHMFSNTEYAIGVPAPHPGDDRKVCLDIKAQFSFGELGRTPKAIGEGLAIQYALQASFGHQPVILKVIRPQLSVDISEPDPIL